MSTYAYRCTQCDGTHDLWFITQIGPATASWACSEHLGQELHRLADRVEPEFKIRRAIGAMSRALLTEDDQS